MHAAGEMCPLLYLRVQVSARWAARAPSSTWLRFFISSEHTEAQIRTTVDAIAEELRRL